MTIDQATLGKRLRDARNNRGISQEEACRKARRASDCARASGGGQPFDQHFGTRGTGRPVPAADH